MRALLFILICIRTVFANDVALESAIFNKVIIAVTTKEYPEVYIYKENKALEQFPGKLKIVNSCKEADIVIITTLKNLPEACKEKILFGTRYSHLRDNRVVGAFFWQKGRPNILFYKRRLERYNIKLDASFDKYIEK
ncbi:hypothetical protein [Sulfurimonas indica]|uniref:hypothetical protein n=1 Tax=Sulfurimonas indica TaxID=2508707 RepID=UPI001263FD1F|nr:hypothetical protein [Sulfurimonas indica]